MVQVDEQHEAAFFSTRDRGNVVDRVIARNVAAMRSSWEEGERAARDLAAQREMLVGVVGTYRNQFDQLLRSHPRARPSAGGLKPLLPPKLVEPSGTGWRVPDRVHLEINNALQRAGSLSSEAQNKLIAGRLWRQAQTYASTAEQVLAALTVEMRRLEAERTATLERRDQQAAELRRTADAELQAAVAGLAEAERDLAAPHRSWRDPAWTSWSGGAAPHPVLLGRLYLPAGSAPGPNADFAQSADLPLFATTRRPLQLSYTRDERELALGLVRSMLLRTLAATPPGKLVLSVFDPTGLGQSVSSLLELAEYDRDLIGGKVWSSSEDLHRVLKEHTAHCELVIQKYLRAEYETLDEYNAAAGEIAEPYRLLVLFDSPTGFDERATTELHRIIENGPRCGVGTVLLTDLDVDLPYGVSFDSLPEALWRVRLGAPFTSVDAESGVMYSFAPETDAQAPAEVIAQIVDHVGRTARDATQSAVSFEKSFGLFADAALAGRKRGLPVLAGPIDAGDAATWWSQSTLEAVAAPIGQRGARDVATLTFDSSDHAGALLVGRPGSGKSTLLHTFIAGITTMYGPEELELHLIDFKEGVEFKVYAAGALPHARTVAIESDREFGVSVLQAIQAELAWRGTLLRGSEESHSSLEALRKATGERLPRIVLVFDEFQVLFARNDKLGAAAADALETLIRQGRGFGIHVLLGSQSLSGLDALGSHVPQLLPVRILLPAAESDAFKVLGDGNTEGASLSTAGEGILNPAGGAVEANERFRGAVIDEQVRRERVAAMRAKADAHGFQRRPVVFEGNASIPADDTPAPRFVDELRGAGPRTLRLRFGAPMAIAGSADIDLRREAGANVLLVARDEPIDAGPAGRSSVPRGVTANLVLSAAVQDATVEVVDFLPIDEGLETFAGPLLEADAIRLSRRRQVPALLERLAGEVERRVDEDDLGSRTILLALFGMHRARDFDQDSVDYDAEVDLPALLGRILRDGPEVGVHTLMWFDTVGSIGRRLPSSAVRESAWRLAGRMSGEDSDSFTGAESAASLREQQVLVANEDRGVLQRCTTIAEPPPGWTQDVLSAWKVPA